MGLALSASEISTDLASSLLLYSALRSRDNRELWGHSSDHTHKST